MSTNSRNARKGSVASVTRRVWAKAEKNAIYDVTFKSLRNACIAFMENGSMLQQLTALVGSGQIVNVPVGCSAAQALQAAGLPLLTSCEQGVCGTCLTRVVSGVPDHRDQYLTPEEQAANDQFLPCCSRARTARLVIDLAG